MIYQSPQNPNAYLTVKDRTWPSYPTKQLWNRNLIQGRVLDFGCGLGADVKFLQENGVDVVGYDPHYAPDYPTGRFDTILCHYVLNVLLPEEQAHVLMAVSELLKPTGKAYFTVRRDIKRSGFRTHTKQNCKVYQCKVILPYPSIIAAEHCEVYEYQHLNTGSGSQRSECSYCSPSVDYELMTESATAYALLVKQENIQVYALIAPKRHVNDYFELSQHEKTACWMVVDRARTLLEKLIHPQGYNISVINAVKREHTHTYICLLPDVEPVTE